MCNKSCDICEQDQSIPIIDVSEDAKRLVALLNSVTNKDITLVMLTKIYLGSRAQNFIDFERLEYFGAGRHFAGTDCIERILRQMITKNILCERHVKNFAGFVLSYVQLGREVSKLANGELKVEITQTTLKVASSKPKRERKERSSRDKSK